VCIHTYFDGEGVCAFDGEGVCAFDGEGVCAFDGEGEFDGEGVRMSELEQANMFCWVINYVGGDSLVVCTCI
jgi:hypothetical protein